MKRLLLALAILLGLALPTNAAITRGVGPLYISASDTGLTASASGTLNSTTIGRSLVIVVMWYDPAASISISSITIGGESNATLVAGSKLTNGAGSVSMQIAYLANNTAGGNKLVTVNFDDTTYSDFSVMEYNGMDTTTQPDNSGTATGTSDATASLSTNSAAALIVVAGINNSFDFTAGSGYTLLGGAGFPNSMYYEEVEDILNAGGVGSKTVSFTGTVSNWDMSFVSFKAAGGSVAAPIRRRVNNQ